MVTKKYKLLKTDTKKNAFGKTLYRIKALMSFGTVTKGDLGGYIEKEKNLSHNGNAWVFGNAMIFGDAKVSGNAWIYGDAKVSGNATISGDAKVSGNATISGNTIFP